MVPGLELAALRPAEVDLAGVRPFWPSSYGRDIDDLAESIAAVGLLRPLWVLEDESGPLLLAGRRRREALLRLGRTTAPAVISPAGRPREEAMAQALADNRERGWNQAETALVWRFLLNEFGEERAELLAGHLSLATSPKLRQWSLSAAGLPEAGLAALADGRLDLECAARLAAWPPESRDAILELFNSLNPSKQKKKQWLDWLEDAARREGLVPADILSAAEIRYALAEAGRIGRPAAEEIARRYLWTRRHPLLAALSAQRQARLRSLGLPKAARLELDPTFEDLKFSLELTFSTPAEFRKLAEVVGGLKDSLDFQKILDDDHEQ